MSAEALWVLDFPLSHLSCPQIGLALHFTLDPQAARKITLMTVDTVLLLERFHQSNMAFRYTSMQTFPTNAEKGILALTGSIT